LASVFFSYSHRDERLRDRLENQLAALKRQGVIETYHDRRIGAGQDVDRAIDAHMDTHDIILLLISPDFIASDYCYDREMKRAMARHEAGKAIVIPVILRPCEWQHTPFGKLIAMPPDGRPVTRWSDRDQAFLEVAKAVREAVKRLGQMKPGQASSVASVPLPVVNADIMTERIVAPSAERVLYDSDIAQDIGFDFEHSPAQLWRRIDGVDTPVSGYGLGRVTFQKGVLDIQRTNTDGRYEVLLRSYLFRGMALPTIPPHHLISGKIRISFEARAAGASHTLRVVLKNDKENRWLANHSQTIVSTSWEPVVIYFSIQTGEECRLRIDDLDVTKAPSSVQIRKFVVAEKTA
jgi:TIR domain-containing protein